MTDIYGLVEVSNGTTLCFYFVTIELNDDTLFLKDRSNGKKPLNIQIPLEKIEEFKTHTVYNTEEISFIFNDNHYKFVEYGNQTISLLSELLEKKMLVFMG
ncbi:hypothetical protein DOK76_06645 [Vagococcus sp. DIV0080]|uniref:Uncharacterized protein n=1 Tax=Candidatus Vagococcus giribetii TaxID=2230876 RepID=A0ABS3HSW3_9ENTE|nr:hypothetical protein [Vagococcus sp. DIV0080]MBO0476741.1 hypothetical protein [Vagococcus sp. DIV0080]